MDPLKDNPRIDARSDEIGRLQREASELQASRRRLAAGADADRRRIERNGVQQSLVAISMTLQLARQALGSAR